MAASRAYHTLSKAYGIVAGFLLLHPNGRLGNQLIELLGASSTFPEKKIIAVNFNEARNYLTTSSAHHWIGAGASYSFLAQVLAKLIWFIKKLPKCVINIFFSLAVESESNNILVHSALIPFIDIIWVDGLFFQNSDSLKFASFARLQSRQSFRHSAIDFMDLHFNPATNLQTYKIFLHLRLGDYLLHDKKIDNSSSNKRYYVLPQAYYQHGLKYILARSPSAYRIFVASDEIETAKRMFDDLTNVIFVEETPELTISILSYCDAGVLSASSFSWWAAHVALLTNNRTGPFIAPKYWLGFSSCTWYPEGFESPFLTYIAPGDLM